MPADPRPPKRVKDPDAMRRFHLEMEGEPCALCEMRVGTQIHHALFRSRGGDDTPSNFVWVCHSCHDDIHSARYHLPQ